MKKIFPDLTSAPFYAMATGIFLIIICHNALSNGMFLDGLIYSAVSRNLAARTGTFWNLHFTATCLADFHEHPPLAIGLQSVLYSVFGESRYIDRLYSFLTIAVEGILITKLWKKTGYKYGWIPLFLWLLTPSVFWASYNNLLENTLTVFTTASVLLYIHYKESNRIILLILSGASLFLAFMVKGFVAFFPLSFPFFLWLFSRKDPFKKAIYDTAVMIFSILVPLFLMLTLIPAARLYLGKYIDDQVLYSIRHIVTVHSRFDIIFRFLNEIIPAVCLCTFCIVIDRALRTGIYREKAIPGKALSFIALGLSGVIPVMISLKQSGFYIVPVYPFLSIAAAMIMYPWLSHFLSKINSASAGFKIFTLLSVIVLLAGISLSVIFTDGYSRDEQKLKDTMSVISVVPAGEIININSQMYEDWSLHAYYSRFGKISLDPDPVCSRKYLLIENAFYSDTLSRSYMPVKVGAKNYMLFIKK